MIQIDLPWQNVNWGFKQTFEGIIEDREFIEHFYVKVMKYISLNCDLTWTNMETTNQC